MTAGSTGSSLDHSTPGGTEVERKFLVRELPDDLVSYPSDKIAQGYISLDPAGAQVRLRRRGYHTLLTIKSGRGLARAEEEFVIDGPRFERLWPSTQGRRVEKTRYRIPLDGGLTLELDVFAGELEGLVMAEVEFESVDDALAFAPPSWLGPEVTDDRRYGNSWLALHGVPESEDAGTSGLVEGEPIVQGLIHVTQAQLRGASSALQSAEPGERAKAIHSARKAFKRGRAHIRVARRGLGDDVVARDNAALRDAGQRLSGTRDAEVLVQTLDGLVARRSSAARPEQVARLREVLVGERDAQHASARADQGAIAEVLELLGVVMSDVAEWTLSDEPAADLADGFARILRKGRKALHVAEHGKAHERTEALHELRKRSKDLWHASELLEIASPTELQTLQEQAHRLADYLGDEHDLAVLAERVDAADRDLFESSHDLAALRDAIAGRRSKLQRKALKLAGEIHATGHQELIVAVAALERP